MISRQICNQIDNITFQRVTDPIQHIAIVANHLVFIIIIDDLKPNPGTLCKLVPRDPLLIQILIQR